MTTVSTPSQPPSLPLEGDAYVASEVIPSRESKSNPGSRLLSKIWTTGGARFNAARRLKAMSRWSLAATSFLSGYVILATAAPVFVPMPLSPKEQGLLNLLLVGIGLFLLILTLLEAGNSYEVRAERLHDCATELAELKNELEIVLGVGNPLDGPALLDFQRRYDAVLGRYSVNHEPIDDKYYRLRYPQDYPEIAGWNWLVRLIIRAEYWGRPRALYFVMIVVPLWGLLSFVS